MLSDSDSVAISASLREAWPFVDYFDALCCSIFDHRAVGIELASNFRIATATGLVVSNESTLLIGSEEILTSVIEQGGVLDPAEVVFHQRGVELTTSMSRREVVFVGADADERTSALRS